VDKDFSFVIPTSYFAFLSSHLQLLPIADFPCQRGAIAMTGRTQSQIPSTHLRRARKSTLYKLKFKSKPACRPAGSKMVIVNRSLFIERSCVLPTASRPASKLKPYF
jgi:hypothetical protein